MCLNDNRSDLLYLLVCGHKVISCVKCLAFMRQYCIFINMSSLVSSFEDDCLINILHISQITSMDIYEHVSYNLFTDSVTVVL